MPPRSKRPRENDDRVEASARSDLTVSAVGNEAEDDAVDARAREDEPATADSRRAFPRSKRPRENDDHVEASARRDRMVSTVGNEAEDDAVDARAREDEPDSRLAELETALAQFTSRFESDDACRDYAVEVVQAIDNAMSNVHSARQTLRELHTRAEEIFDAMEADIERTAWKIVLDSLECADRVEAMSVRVEEAKAYIAQLHDVHATT
jgi:hypothetical protein